VRGLVSALTYHARRRIDRTAPVIGAKLAARARVRMATRAKTGESGVSHERDGTEAWYPTPARAACDALPTVLFINRGAAVASLILSIEVAE